MALNISSKGIDNALKNVMEMNKNISNISKSTDKNMLMFQKRLKTSETLMSRMAKSASSMSTSIRLGVTALAGLAFGKAMGAFKSSMDQYGSASSMFRSKANKSDSLSDLTLSRALELATGDEQKGLQNSLGQMAADATVAGSDAQSLLLQAGFDPAEFAKMSQLDRLKTLIEAFNKMGNDVAFREMFENISGLKGSELEALSGLMPDIEKNFAELSKTMKGIDPQALSNTDAAWKKLLYSFQDFMALLSSKAAPYVTKAFEQIKTKILEFVESGGIERTIKWLSDTFNTISNLLGPGTTLTKIFNIIGIVWDGLVEAGRTVVNAFKLVWNAFGLTVDYLKLFFNNMMKVIYTALDKIPGLDYSGEIRETDASIATINKSIDENKKDLADAGSGLLNNYANQAGNVANLLGELGWKEGADTAKQIQVYIRSSESQSQLANPVISQVGK